MPIVSAINELNKRDFAHRAAFVADACDARELLQDVRMAVPALRIRRVGNAPLRAEGQYVLYWMTAFRRLADNFALDRAVELAQQSNKPLLVLEPLRAAYPWASDRFHEFVIQGMADNAAACSKARVTYYPYVEPSAGAGKGLLNALAERAVAVVADDFPCFFLPRAVAAAAQTAGVHFEAIDSNGLVPLRAAPKLFLRAVDFRRFLQNELPRHLQDAPRSRPLVQAGALGSAAIPKRVLARWPPAPSALLDRTPGTLSTLVPQLGQVGRGALDGGSLAADRTLKRFIADRLESYEEHRNHPDLDAASHLSPYLHFGHLSAHRVVGAIARVYDFDLRAPDTFGARRRGERSGFWQLSAGPEAFLDQLTTWRELGFNFCHHRPHDYDAFSSLPEWSRATLETHRKDARSPVYTLEQQAAAATHDPIWNAAQRQLVRDGRMHGYLRMLWGKKVIEWSPSPQEALATLLELNNRYALDGRDPNSYSGIFWCFGRYDRPWGPERPIFGTVRFMSSANTARKVRLREYLRRYAE